MMAYVSHGSYRTYHHAESRTSADPVVRALFFKSALIALAAGVVILGLSEVAPKASVAQSVTAAKGDRLVAASMRPSTSARQSDVVFKTDMAAQTTTVSRGAAVPFSPDSPYLSSVR